MSSLAALGHFKQAKRHAGRAAKVGANDAFMADMIGFVYSRAGDHETAIPFFQDAVARDPKWPLFQFNLGASAEFLGDFDTARSAYAGAVQANPKFYRGWFALAALEKQTADNNRLADLEAIYAGLSGDADAQLLIGHAIAKTLEDLGRYEDSYDWLEICKAAKREDVGFERDELSKSFKLVSARSGPPKAPQTPPTNEAPIFIVGLPRTGTTLVDRIISAHSKVISGGELGMFANLLKQRTGTPSDFIMDARTAIGAANVDLAELGRTFMEQTRHIAPEGDRLTDKTTLNFFYAGAIHSALPNARIIAVRRGAMDSCLSNFRQLFATENLNYDYSFDIEDIAALYRDYDGLMTHWQSSLPKSRFMQVGYEDIINDQETQTRRLLDFSGLDFEQACLNFQDNTAAVSSASAVQVRQPLYAGSIGRWKKYGDKKKKK